MNKVIIWVTHCVMVAMAVMSNQLLKVANNPNTVISLLH